MIVRGWLMIGGQDAAQTLPPEKKGHGIWIATPAPNAADFNVGDWLLWTPYGSFWPECLVCVEVPLG